MVSEIRSLLRPPLFVRKPAITTTSRSRAWTHTLASTARWTDTNSALPKSMTGSVGTANPFSNSSSLILTLFLLIVVLVSLYPPNIVVALRRICDHHHGHGRHPHYRCRSSSARILRWTKAGSACSGSWRLFLP